MDGIFTIEDGTKILAVLQAVDNKIETFGMAYAQPDGRVVVRLRNKDRKGRKTVIDLCSEDKPVISDEAVRRLFSVADLLRSEGKKVSFCSSTTNSQELNQWSKLFGTDEEGVDPEGTLTKRQEEVGNEK